MKNNKDIAISYLKFMVEIVFFFFFCYSKNYNKHCVVWFFSDYKVYHNRQNTLNNFTLFWPQKQKWVIRTWPFWSCIFARYFSILQYSIEWKLQWNLVKLKGFKYSSGLGYVVCCNLFLWYFDQSQDLITFFPFVGNYINTFFPFVGNYINIHINFDNMIRTNIFWARFCYVLALVIEAKNL